MEHLSRDSYRIRGRPSEGDRRDGLVIYAFLFLACALLVFSRLNLEPVSWLRWRLIGAVQPILEGFASPVARVRQAGERAAATMDALAEIEQLRSANQRLRGWEWRARELERKLAQVSVLARTAEEIGLEFVTGRVIADARGPFANTVLVNVGRREGVLVGFAAVSGDGLVGHVVDVGESAARILLLNDPSSRIPVIAGPAPVRAIVKGEGTDDLRLTHPAGSTSAAGGQPALQTGDDVLTSGDEGLLPRGLKVGAVRLDDTGPRVVLAARLEGLEFVSLLFFKSPVLAKEAAPPAASAAGERGQQTTRGKMEPTSARKPPGLPGWPSP